MGGSFRGDVAICLGDAVTPMVPIVVFTDEAEMRTELLPSVVNDVMVEWGKGESVGAMMLARLLFRTSVGRVASDGEARLVVVKIVGTLPTPFDVSTSEVRQVFDETADDAMNAVASNATVLSADVVIQF
jgi:hypothetical protein